MKNDVRQLSQCSECGQKIDPSLTTCPLCHDSLGLEALAGIDPNIKVKNQKRAVLFSALLGGLGIHKFYLDQPIEGSLYLLFSWTLVPIIIGWIDAIRTSKMSPSSFEQRYCR